MSWNSLLCHERLHPQNKMHSQHRTAFEIDYDRLIFSKAFRRLARKTQVHPLALNDHTHNRLTHSLEVASVGRSLGRAAFSIAQRHESQTIEATANDFADLVQAACLAHDVGNTPFGHAGERAIRQWMRNHTEIHAEFNHAQIGDLVLYEGNAQAFRIATRSISGIKNGYDNRIGGLRLTAATLATMMKYPWYSDHDRAQHEGKYSVFQSDKSAFEWVVQTTGLLAQDGAYCRHPLAYLVEAADDICNAVIDIEDAIDLQILRRTDVEQHMKILSGSSGSSSIAEMRSSTIGKLVEQCLQVFEHSYESIMQGERDTALIHGIEKTMLDAFNALNDIAKHKVYPFQQDENLEQNCNIILSRILVASLKGNTFNDNLTENYLPLKQIAKDSVVTPFLDFIEQLDQVPAYGYERIMIVMDFISGMTDNYALNLASRLNSDSN